MLTVRRGDVDNLDVGIVHELFVRTVATVDAVASRERRGPFGGA